MNDINLEKKYFNDIKKLKNISDETKSMTQSSIDNINIRMNNIENALVRVHEDMENMKYKYDNTDAKIDSAEVKNIYLKNKVLADRNMRMDRNMRRLKDQCRRYRIVLIIDTILIFGLLTALLAMKGM